MMNVEQSAPAPRAEAPESPKKESRASSEYNDDMFSRMVSAPVGNVGGNWRDARKNQQHDLFGGETGGGGGAFDLSAGGAAAAGGFFDFEGEEEKGGRPSEPSKELKGIFEDQDEDEDIYADDKDEELLRYSAAGVKPSVPSKKGAAGSKPASVFDRAQAA